MRGNIATNAPEMHVATGEIKLKIKAHSDRIAEIEKETDAPIVMRHLALVEKLFGMLSLITEIIEDKDGNIMIARYPG